MDMKKQYDSEISEQQSEHVARMRLRKKEQEEEGRIRPDFHDFCKKITKYRAARLLNKVYKSRDQAGLPPFTHSYDYPLREDCWLAKRNFTAAGRFGANSGDFIFVRKGVEIIRCDHTKVIYVDDWENNDFVPAYSNTV